MTTARPAPRHSTLTLRIILGMALGIALGLAAPGKLAVLGIFGKLLIQLIKAVAVPLVFVSVLDALLATNITWQSGKKLLVITLVNGCIASAIALTLTNLIQPGSYLDFRASARELALDTGTSFADKKLNPIEVLTGHIPGSIFQPFLDNDVIGVVLMALLLGVQRGNFHLPMPRKNR